MCQSIGKCSPPLALAIEAWLFLLLSAAEDVGSYSLNLHLMVADTAPWLLLIVEYRSLGPMAKEEGVCNDKDCVWAGYSAR